MRVLLAILGVLVVGGLAYAGCFDFQMDWDDNDNDNGDGCAACDLVVCEDDRNECTEVMCDCDTGECFGFGEPFDGMVCELDGSTGVCEGGVCQEDVWCNGACDDGNECTVNFCRLGENVCDELTPTEARVEDGTVCSGGACADGVCDTFVDQCTVDDLAAIEARREPKADAITTCRGEWNGLPEPKEGCITFITNCLQGFGTSLTADCSNCFALRECCMVYECRCELPLPHCDQCVEETCQPLVDACLGRQ